MPRSRLDTCLCVALVAAALSASAARAGVTQLAAQHRDGQTFLTWSAASGTGVTHRIYSSPAPLTSAADLAGATLVGAVGDSSACDRRLSRLLGVLFGYSVDSLAAPLAPGNGLFVHTPTSSSARWYAVTTQAAGFAEDSALVPGVNALTSSVREVVAPPRPVYQRSLALWPQWPVQIYTLWPPAHDTPAIRAMGNREGLGFDCAIVRSPAGSTGALLVRMHSRGTSFLDGLGGSGRPNEVVLSLDDPLPNGQNTFWYGYHPDYDITTAFSPPPTTGVVQDYTLRRVDWMLDWALRNFPVDSTRVYAFGYSMGGIGSVQLALRRPDRIAAVMAVIPKFDFSFLADPDTLSAFNLGQPLRSVVDQMWGTVASNLPSSDGPGVYDLLDGSSLAASPALRWIPPILAFNGRHDHVVGWAEKIPFYSAMNQHHRGGMFFWDSRGHFDGDLVWTPMQYPAALYPFRTNRSFPALSHCSLDSDPGEGTPATGDEVGNINAYVEWDTTFQDTEHRWDGVIRMRALQLTTGPLPRPDSCTVDVTPSRLQHFALEPGAPYDWSVLRLTDAAVIQSGSSFADSLGRATIHAVRVDTTGSRVTLVNTNWLAAGRPSGPARLALSVSGNPLRARGTLHFAWPASGDARVELLDVAGRRVRTLYHGRAEMAPTRLPLDARGLPAGLYFVRAEAAGERLARRVVVIH